jgi:nicotinamidase-related amidase
LLKSRDTWWKKVLAMDAQKVALLIIDMQKDVMKELVTTGLTVISSIQIVLDAFRKKNAPVIFLKRVHRKNGVDIELFRTDLFKEKPFLVQNTEGAEVVDELKPLPSEYSVSKQRFCGFFQSDLLMILTRLKIESLIICGVQTPNCIRGTVMDALSYDYLVTVLEDATAAQSDAIHAANLLDMKNMGVEIKKVKDFLSQF